MRTFLAACIAASAVAHRGHFKELKNELKEMVHDVRGGNHHHMKEGRPEMDMALHTDYMRYVATYNKVYDSNMEYQERLGHFKRNVMKANELNSNPESQATFGITKFSDWSDEEFEAIQGLKAVADQAPLQWSVSMVQENNADSVDWRESGHVTAVKDQGQCGSCWAFSSTGALESAWSIAGRGLPELSEQQLVDCSRAYGNLGCSGGWYFWAYDYLDAQRSDGNSQNALESETEYPYHARNQTCADKDDGTVTVSGSVGYTSVSPGLSTIKAAIAKQPVNVAVAAGNSVFQGYTGGIITQADGCPTNIDHAILAVGYGSENGTEYYIVKNSWGSGWGEDGYVRIEAIDGRTGVCGINQYVYYPIV